MKTTLTIVCSSLSLLMFFGCSDTPSCDHPTRLFSNFLIDVPADFSGTYEEEIYGGKKAIVTAKNCNGPFHVKLILANGSIETEMTFEKGELIVDSVYVESPDPPYDLHLLTDTVYDSNLIEKGL